MEIKEFFLESGKTNIFNVSADVSLEYAAVSTQNNVTVFSVKTFEPFWSFQIEYPIGFISISEDSHLLFVVDVQDVFHMYHIPTKQNLWRVTCPVEDASSVALYKILPIFKPSGYLSVFIIFTNWSICEISDIFIPDLYKALKNGNVSQVFHGVNIKKLDLTKSHPKREVIHIFPVYLKNASLGILFKPVVPEPVTSPSSEVTNGSVYETSNDICNVTLVTNSFSEESCLNGKTLETQDISSQLDAMSIEECRFFSNPCLIPAVKIIHTRNGKFLIALIDSAIHMLCAKEGTPVSTWTAKYSIEDFVLNETSQLDSEWNLLKIGLKSWAPDKSHYAFEIRTLPSFELVFQVDSTNFMLLAKCIPDQDFWSIVSGSIIPENLSESQVTDLKVSFFLQPSPVTRLLNLIENGKIAEAEELARNQNLNFEIIHKPTIKNILLELSQDERTLSSEEITEMWISLDRSLKFIKDPSFIESCILCVLPDIDHERKLLFYIQKWINNQDKSKEVFDLLSKVNHYFKKINTFTQLDSGMDLHSFLNQDLLEYMVSELNQGNLSSAFIVWQEHKDEFIVSLNANVESIIKAIPSATPSKILIPFLDKDFLPAVFLACPDSIETIAAWISCRVRDFDIYEETLWPENGLQLLTVTLSKIKKLFSKENEGKTNCSNDFACVGNYVRLQDAASSVGALAELPKDLMWIQTLKKDLNCIVRLTDFKKSNEDVIFSVLDNIDIEHLNAARDKFVRPFARERHCDLDPCLEKYLMRALEKESWIAERDDALEERLVAVVNSIDSSTQWMNAALVLLGKANVPWSSRVKQLVQKALGRDHPKRAFFLAQSKMVGFKEVIVKYNLKKHFHLYFREKSTLVSYIFKENRPSALEDAKKVLASFSEEVEPYEVYFEYLQFSLNRNRVDEFFKCFSGISQDIGIKCATRLLRYIKLVLDEFLMKDNEEFVRNLLYAGVYLVKYLKKLKQPVDENLLIQFKCLEKLQDEFGVSLTLTELLSECSCQALIKKAVHDFVTLNIAPEKECGLSLKKSSKSPPGILQIYRFGHILLIEREKVLGLLITECLKEKKYDLVLTLCNEIIDTIENHQTSHATQTLVQVVQHFFDNFSSLTQADFAPIVDAIQRLVGTVVTYTSEDTLLDNMHTLNLSTYLSSIKSCVGKSLVVNPEHSLDAYNTWKFSPHFQDQGFQLDFKVFIEFLIAVFKQSAQPDHSSGDKSLISYDSFKSAQHLITHMSEMGHSISLLRTVYLIRRVTNQTFQDPKLSQYFSGLLPVIKNCVNSVIKQAVSQRKVDLDFAFHVLSLVPKEIRDSILKNLVKWSSRNLKSLAHVACIGMQVALTGQEAQSFSEYERIFKRANFLLSQQTKSVPIELILNPTPNPHHSWTLVKDLISSHKLDLSTVLSCCSAFHLRPDPVLLAYLKELLVKNEARALLSGESSTDHLEEVLKEADLVIRAVGNEEELYAYLVNVSKEISPYSYEILLFIKEQLQSLSASLQTISPKAFETDIKLLKFLKVYKRIAPPGDVEKERYQALLPSNPDLPDISNTRLPFLYSMQKDLTKIINPELRANTLKVWFETVSILKVLPDHMSIIAVKNCVDDYVSHLSSKEFVPCHDLEVVATIQEMIAGISSEENLVALASWVAMNMPPGGNRIEFASAAVRYAQQWYAKNQSQESVANILRKMMLIHQQFSIEAVLYENGLQTPELLSLITSPVQLMECLLEKYLLSDTSAKVCKAAVEIAKISNIKIIDIFLKYILDWLNSSPGLVNNMDETFLETFEPPDDNDESDYDNLKRIIDLLLCISKSELYSDLLNEVMKSLGNMEQSQQNRLLFCLVSAFGYPYVSSLLKCDPLTLKESLLAAICAMQLKDLGFPYSAELFRKCDKAELVGKILSAKLHYPKAVKFCIKMCMEFSIWDTSLWEVILKRLSIKPSDFAVQDVLETVQGHLPHMWSNQNFVDAWKCAVDCIFKSKYADNFQFLNTVYKSLLRCPCAHLLDVQELVAKLGELNLEELRGAQDICSLISILRTQCERKCVEELSEE